MKKLKALYVEYAFALLLLLAGMALTITAATVFHHRHIAKVEAMFNEAAEDRIETAKGFLNYALFTLRSLDAFYQASENVTETEFQLFAKPLFENNPHIRALNWVPHVPAADRAEFERKMAATRPNFTFTTQTADRTFIPENGKPDYYPIIYSYPPRDRDTGLGFDVSSEPLRADTIKKARASNKPQASPLIKFLNEKDPEDALGIVVFAPAHDATGRFEGFISTSISLTRMIEEALRPLSQQGVHIILRDVSSTADSSTLLYTRSSRLLNTTRKDIMAASANPDMMRLSDTITFANRQWQIEIVQAPGYFSTAPSPAYYNILGFGTLLSVLFTVYLFSLSHEKDRIRAQVLDRTAALNRAKHNTEQILTSSHEGIIGVNRLGQISFCNPAASKLLGCRDDEQLVGRDYHATIRPSLEGTLVQRKECGILHILEDGKTRNSSAYDFIRADESAMAVEFTAAPVVDDNDITGAVIVFRDITARRSSEQKLAYAAGHDQLTGLYNRRTFESALEGALARATRSANKCAVLYMDLNGFKKINDTLGHDAGDVMLVSFAQRLRQCMRETDTVARLGGDEFAVICEMLDNEGSCIAAINRLLANIDTTPVDLSGQRYNLSTSIGLALFPDDAATAADLIKAADTAMYVVKKDKPRRYHRAGQA